MKMAREKNRQTVLYWVPIRINSGSLEKKLMKGLVRKRPIRAKKIQLSTERVSPFPAAFLAAARSRDPSFLESRELTPIEVPTLTEIRRFCSGKAKVTAVKAVWL
jgi:transglutaminase-like putative cysteine protease